MRNPLRIDVTAEKDRETEDHALASFHVNLKQARVILEKGTSTVKMSLSGWLMGKPVVYFLLGS